VSVAFEINPGFFSQFAVGALLFGFLGIDSPLGKSPLATALKVLLLNQENFIGMDKYDARLRADGGSGLSLSRLGVFWNSNRVIDRILWLGRSHEFTNVGRLIMHFL
jgi:hypothetical protein